MKRNLAFHVVRHLLQSGKRQTELLGYVESVRT